MKNAFYCILFGLLCAFAACSATKLAKTNIRIQKLDTSSQKQQPLQQAPPRVPALVLLHTGYPLKPKQDFTPFKDSLINGLKTLTFKDSLINGLKNIKEGIDQANSKLDTGLNRQHDYIKGQKDVIATLFSMQAKNATISKEVKDDAMFGNTYKKFSVYVLLFIASGIIAILIMIFVVHNTLSKQVKRLKQHA